MYMPPAAMHHAKMAPKGPVAMPKVRGNEKIPEPTIDPTTIAVRANRESLCTGCDVMPCLDNSDGENLRWSAIVLNGIRLAATPAELQPKSKFGFSGGFPFSAHCTFRVRHDIG
jgi:hypothetical protein